MSPTRVRFRILRCLDDIEEQIAGSREERQIMMPLQYITSSKEKAEVEVLFITLTLIIERDETHS